MFTLMRKEEVTIPTPDGEKTINAVVNFIRHKKYEDLSSRLAPSLKPALSAEQAAEYSKSYAQQHDPRLWIQILHTTRVEINKLAQDPQVIQVLQEEVKKPQPSAPTPAASCKDLEQEQEERSEQRRIKILYDSLD